MISIADGVILCSSVCSLCCELNEILNLVRPCFIIASSYFAHAVFCFRPENVLTISSRMLTPLHTYGSYGTYVRRKPGQSHRYFRYKHRQMRHCRRISRTDLTKFHFYRMTLCYNKSLFEYILSRNSHTKHLS